jgi:hypothetical protein
VAGEVEDAHAFAEGLAEVGEGGCLDLYFGAADGVLVAQLVEDFGHLEAEGDLFVVLDQLVGLFADFGLSVEEGEVDAVIIFNHFRIDFGFEFNLFEFLFGVYCLLFPLCEELIGVDAFLCLCQLQTDLIVVAVGDVELDTIFIPKDLHDVPPFVFIFNVNIHKLIDLLLFDVFVDGS